MDVFQRQILIPGWDQQRFRDAHVAVFGGNELATYTALGLRALGVGQISLLGKSNLEAATLAQGLLGGPAPDDLRLDHFSFNVEYGPELTWVLGGRPPRVLVDCGDDLVVHAFLRDYSAAEGLPLLDGTATGGGWYGSDRSAECMDAGSDPIAAMAVSALLVDAVRETICPLLGGLMPRTGPLGFRRPDRASGGTGVLVGAGGIGAYVALLAAQLNQPLVIVDFDDVETSNLNRQALFRLDDALHGTPKALAARDALVRLYPGANVSTLVHRVEADSVSTIARLQPAVLLSAVDNAETRLVLQEHGRALGIPVVQGGTSIFAADCYTQGRRGPLLDEQMHGALTNAAAREAGERRAGSCSADPAYVVPGMIAAAMMVHRADTVGSQSSPAPLHWRAGHLPIEERNLVYDLDLYEFSA